MASHVVSHPPGMGAQTVRRADNGSSMDNAKPLLRSRGGESAFLYLSEPSPAIDADAIHEIVRTSRVRNEASAITGLLMFDGSHFAQWLEGPLQAMDRLLTLLRVDPRHRRMDVLWFESPGLGRRFPHWHFGYLDVRRVNGSLRRLSGTRGVDAMLLFGELSRGLAAEQSFSTGLRRPAGFPSLYATPDPQAAAIGSLP